MSTYLLFHELKCIYQRIPSNDGAVAAAIITSVAIVVTAVVETDISLRQHRGDIAQRPRQRCTRSRRRRITAVEKQSHLPSRVTHRPPQSSEGSLLSSGRVERTLHRSPCHRYSGYWGSPRAQPRMLSEERALTLLAVAAKATTAAVVAVGLYCSSAARFCGSASVA